MSAPANANDDVELHVVRTAGPTTGSVLEGGRTDRADNGHDVDRRLGGQP